MFKRILSGVSIAAGALGLVACGGGGGGSAPATPSYTIGGTLNGLDSGQSITLLDDGGDAMILSGNGSFQFRTPVTWQGRYGVAIGTQPAGQACIVANASGSGVVANVTDVSVECARTDPVGGTVSGLAVNGYVDIQNGRTDGLRVNADGPFSFAVKIGDNYAVTIESQSVGQVCAVTNGVGNNVQANVGNISIRCTPETPTEEILHSFAGGSDGSSPRAGVIMDASGALYGTTHAGGSSDQGTVYKLTPNAGGGYVEAILYSFTGGTDGSHPDAHLALDACGNLYGEAGPGNLSGAGGSVFMLTPTDSGTYALSTLHDFSATPGGAIPAGGLVPDANGNLFGTTHSTSAAGGFGAVFELSPSGLLAGDGTDSGTCPITGLFDFNLLYTFAGGADGENPQSDLIVAPWGNLYGTTKFGGTADLGTVFALVPNAAGGYTKTTLHSFDGADGSQPIGHLAYDSSLNLYGATSLGGASGNGTVFEISQINGNPVETVIHSFAGGLDGNNPQAGLQADDDGNLYGETYGSGGTAAGANGTIFEISPAGGGAFAFMTLYAFAGAPDGSAPIDGVAVDAGGNLYGVTQSGGGAGQGTVFRLKR